jgi:16S rRNA (guanine966-N2)-methyltransferase
MRVVGGELGGRPIAAPRGRATRPTSERAREAIFSILADVGGARVLDLFAGSGALGIEALSRGAVNATFVDSSAAAAAAIERNLASLGLRERARVMRCDVRIALRGAARSADAYDLVFIDPPYAAAGELATLLDAALPALLAPRARVLSESDRREPLKLSLPLLGERRYGDTIIAIHQQNELADGR